MICHICNNYCKSPHYTSCGVDQDRNFFKMRLLEHNFPNAHLSTGDFIADLYLNQEMSLPELQKITKISTKTLYFVLDYFNIKKRTASEANGSARTTSKRTKTFIERYGAPNPLCAGTSSYLKRQETVKRRYGVDNVWKLKDVKQKITETHLERYGCKRVISIGADRINKFETRIAAILVDLGLPFKYSVKISGRQFDFQICENIILECNGSFWHANPKKYSENDIIKWPGGPVRAGDVWARDKEKADLARSAGFEIIYVWDTDNAYSVIAKALHLQE